jgi:hypothetical protein
VRDLPGTEDDARRPGTGTAAAELEVQEDRCADDEKVQQRFPEQ